MELILVASDLDRKIRIKVETKGGKTKPVEVKKILNK